MKKPLLFLAFLFAASCATTHNYEARLERFVGKTSDELTRVWGTPNQVTTYADGRRGFEYRFGDEHNVRETASYRSLRSADVGCVTTFFIDPGGIVTNWKWEGHACTAK